MPDESPKTRWQHLRKVTMRHPLALYMAVFTSLVLATIVTIIFTITFRGVTTETEVYTSVGEQDGVRISWIQKLLQGADKRSRSQFVFIGHIFHVDLDLRQMLVNWQPAGCGKYLARTEQSYSSLNYGTGTNCGRPSVNVSLFINGQVRIALVGATLS